MVYLHRVTFTVAMLRIAFQVADAHAQSNKKIKGERAKKESRDLRCQQYALARVRSLQRVDASEGRVSATLYWGEATKCQVHAAIFC